MSRTRRKLEEAEYFLCKLEAAIADHPDFDYLFSAFVSAARSVTWIMKAEYKDNTAWADWYSTKAPSDSERRLMRQMNDLRIRSEKYDPLQTQPAIVIEFPPEAVTPQLRAYFEEGTGKRFRTWIFELPEDGQLALPPGVPQEVEMFAGRSLGMVRHVPELEDNDVVKACSQYLAALQELIVEGESAAGAA